MTSLSIVSSWQKHQENTWQLSRIEIRCIPVACRKWLYGLTTDPGLQAHPPHVTSQSTIKWPCQGFQGLARGQYGGSWIHTRLFEQPAPTDIRPVDKARPTNLARILWLVFADALSDGTDTQHETATPGTANTSWQYYPGIASTRRFIAGIERRCLFSRFTPPPDAVPVTVLLETPTLLRCSIPPYPVFHSVIAARDWAWRDTDPKVATFARPRQLYRTGPPCWCNGGRMPLILPCTNYCNKGTLTYLLQAMAVKGWLRLLRLGNWTNHEVIWDCEGTARGSPMQSPSRRIRSYVPSSVLDSLHPLPQLETADDLRVTSYCDNSSLLKRGRIPHSGRGFVKLVLEARPRRNHDS
jgi:hypothetical protein